MRRSGWLTRVSGRSGPTTVEKVIKISIESKTASNARRFARLSAKKRELGYKKASVWSSDSEIARLRQILEVWRGRPVDFESSLVDAALALNPTSAPLPRPVFSLASFVDTDRLDMGERMAVVPTEDLAKWAGIALRIAHSRLKTRRMNDATEIFSNLARGLNADDTGWIDEDRMNQAIDAVS